MDTLRIILIVFGLLLVVGIYLYDRLKRRRAAQEQSWGDLEADESGEELGSFSTDGGALPDEWVGKSVTISAKRNEQLSDEHLDGLKGLGATEEEIEPQSMSLTSVETTAEVKQCEPQQEEVFVFTLMAGEDNYFSGPLLLKVLLESGLHHGDMGIFHYQLAGSEAALFSVANILEPGSFELAKIASLQTPGLALFMRLPTLIEGGKALQILLIHAKQMAAQLSGTLCDAQRRPLDDDALESLQQKANTYTAIPS